MATTNFSKHMTKDRVDRYVVIATKVGFGETLYVKQERNKYGLTKVELTSTGVLIVRGMDETIITMFCATISIAKKHFEVERFSKHLYNSLRLNERKGYCNI